MWPFSRYLLHIKPLLTDKKKKKMNHRGYLAPEQIKHYLYKKTCIFGAA